MTLMKSNQPTSSHNPLQHVAIIMDGNGRWANARSLSRSQGHTQGVKNTISIVKHAATQNIQYLTLYAFSKENWKRPKVEVATLMELLKTFLFSELPTFKQFDVKLKTIGDTSNLPFFAKEALDHVKEKTKDHKTLTLILALGYSGRDEITRSVQAIGKKIASGELKPNAIDEDLISQHLDTHPIPDPDLIIRTSGEFRTSNFLPWQSVYSEYYVTKTLWPDFTPQEFDQAILQYKQRERRFGKTSEQIHEEKN